MAKFDIRQWAVRGAEQRLLELAEEARAIFAAFPELRGRGRGFDAGALQTARRSGGARRRQNRAGAPRRTRRLSAEARRRISDAQKARWAKHRAQKSAAAARK